MVAKYNHNYYVQLFAGVGYAKYSNSNVANDTFGRKYQDTKDNTVGQLGMLIKF